MIEWLSYVKTALGSPIIIFIIFLIVGYIIYLVGGMMAPKLKRVGGKLSMYACGEDIPARKVMPSYQFFYVAFFFTILHICALMIATMPSGNAAVFGMIYILVVIVGVIALLLR
jgi:NADH-quinone oxidoreductase subunit A